MAQVNAGCCGKTSSSLWNITVHAASWCATSSYSHPVWSLNSACMLYMPRLPARSPQALKLICQVTSLSQTQPSEQITVLGYCRPDPCCTCRAAVIPIPDFSRVPSPWASTPGDLPPPSAAAADQPQPPAAASSRMPAPSWPSSAMHASQVRTWHLGSVVQWLVLLDSCDYQNPIQNCFLQTTIDRQNRMRCFVPIYIINLGISSINSVSWGCSSDGRALA